MRGIRERPDRCAIVRSSQYNRKISGLDAFADAFLPKPVDPERLLRQLLGHVPASATPGQPGRPAQDDVVSDETGRYAS